MIKILNIQNKDGCELMHGHYDVLAELQDDCTNGDILMAIFPNAIKSNYIESSMNFEDYVEVYLGDYLMRVSYDWWNTPYKVESEV